MSQQVFIWIIGICALIFATSMAVQGLAALQLLRIIKPLIGKNRRLMNQSKHLVELSKKMVRDVKPGLAISAAKARELVNIATARIVDRRQEAQGVSESLRRLRRSPRAKPRRIKSQAGFDSGVSQHKIGEEH